METLTRLSLTLVESEAPDLAYIFKHAVTQEVAYNLMLYSQRRQLHQAVAEWIEQSNESNLESFYPLLAHHWSQAAEVHDAASIACMRFKRRWNISKKPASRRCRIMPTARRSSS